MSDRNLDSRSGQSQSHLIPASRQPGFGQEACAEVSFNGCNEAEKRTVLICTAVA